MTIKQMGGSATTEQLLTAWLQSVLEIIEKNFSNLVLRLDGYESWYEADDRSLVRRPFMMTYRFGELDRLIFTENPVWKELGLRIADDDLIKKHSSRLVGSPYGVRRAFTVQELCKLLLPHPIQVDAGVKVDTTMDAAAAVQKLLNVFRSDTLDEVTIWPIGGINVPQSIKLDEHTEFRELSTTEKLNCLHFGMIRGFESGRIAPEHSRWYGLVHTEVYPKVFEAMEAVPSDFTERWHRRETLLEHLLASLSVITGRRVSHAGGHSAAPSIHFGTSIPVGMTAMGASSFSFNFLFSEQDPPLTEQQIKDLHSYWKMLAPTGRSKFEKRLLNALHRYYFAQTRAKPEDMIVDLMIAAESLYLDTDKDELTYRLSLNAALWAEGDTAKKKEIFDLFKKAYGLRSSVVHGSSVSRSSLQEPLEQVRQEMSRAIQKAFDFIRSNPGAKPEWTNMLFPPSNPQLDLGS